MFPGGDIFVPSPLKMGTNLHHSPSTPIVERLKRTEFELCAISGKTFGNETTLTALMPKTSKALSAVVLDPHIQRIILAAGETTMTPRVSHKPVEYQSR